MKVSKNWLKELVDLNISFKELEEALPRRTIGTKEITEDFFELDMKGYNRADLLSLRGIANEVSAVTNSSLKVEDLDPDEFVWHNKNLPEAKIAVEGDNLCPVYCIAKIEGLKVEKSPAEWTKKLSDSGFRSINTVADVTNLVMLEYGQPLHAFDAQFVEGQTLIVRSARTGETLTTLDGKTRELISGDIVIADPDKPLGLAGVMGGKESEITDQTNTIFLEAAIFNGKALRRTSQRLNLFSEAGKRFQHGLTTKRLLQALNAAIRMYRSLGGKLTQLTLFGNFNLPQKNIILRFDKTNQLIGTRLEKPAIESILKRLSFEVQTIDNNTWQVTPPYYRLDICLEEDVIEEVARIYGYEKIQPKELEGGLPPKIGQSNFKLIHELKEQLAQSGLTEVQTYSFYSSKILNTLGADKNTFIKIINPMSSETEYMRDLIWPNLVEVVVENLKRESDVAVFEIGKTFLPIQGGVPKEAYKLSIALSNGTDNPIEELHALTKEVTERFFGGLKIASSANNKLFHPTRQFVVIGNSEKGSLAEVHPRMVDRMGSEKRIAVLEITMPQLLQLSW